MQYLLQTHPFVVPTTDGKLIEEHFGRAANQQAHLSIARMVAPPGWGEPLQQPLFDEYTLVYKGKKQVQVGGSTIVLSAGQSILIKGGTPVQYSNPFNESCEYYSICLPAFSIDTVNRQPE